MIISPNDLREAASGTVLVPGDPGFDAECSGFNLAVVQHPDVVVAAASVGVLLAKSFYLNSEVYLAMQSRGSTRS